MVHTIDELKSLAKEARAHILTVAATSGASHLGSCLSAVDILTALFFSALDIPSFEEPNRDRFILSKGHAALALYVTLFQKGAISKEELYSFWQDGTKLAGHPVLGSAAGIEASTGSLGHGLSLGLGLSLASDAYRTYVLLSDGEMDEGAVWEAILFAGHVKSKRLIAIVDYNKIQSFGHVRDVLDLEPFAAKWRDANWSCHEVDGHDMGALLDTLVKVRETDGPHVIIAHTVKGKGIPYMENEVSWHYWNVRPEDLESTLALLQ